VRIRLTEEEVKDVLQDWVSKRAGMNNRNVSQWEIEYPFGKDQPFIGFTIDKPEQCSPCNNCGYGRDRR